MYNLPLSVVLWRNTREMVPAASGCDGCIRSPGWSTAQRIPTRLPTASSPGEDYRTHHLPVLWHSRGTSQTVVVHVVSSIQASARSSRLREEPAPCRF